MLFRVKRGEQSYFIFRSQLKIPVKKWKKNPSISLKKDTLTWIFLHRKQAQRHKIKVEILKGLWNYPILRLSFFWKLDNLTSFLASQRVPFPRSQATKITHKRANIPCKNEQIQKHTHLWLKTVIKNEEKRSTKS